MNYQFIVVIIGGLLLGFGFLKIWHGESKVRRPKVRGQKRAYYTMGDIWMMKLRAKWRNWRNKEVI